MQRRASPGEPQSTRNGGDATRGKGRTENPRHAGPSGEPLAPPSPKRRHIPPRCAGDALPEPLPPRPRAPWPRPGCRCPRAPPILYYITLPAPCSGGQSHHQPPAAAAAAITSSVRRRPWCWSALPDLPPLLPGFFELS